MQEHVSAPRNSSRTSRRESCFINLVKLKKPKIYAVTRCLVLYTAMSCKVLNSCYCAIYIAVNRKYNRNKKQFKFFQGVVCAFWANQQKIGKKNLVSSKLISVKLPHTYILNLLTYLIDHSPMGLFRANEINNGNKLNRLRILTCRRQTSWLCTSVAEELNQGLPGANPASGLSTTRTLDLQISNPTPLPLGHADSYIRVSLVS